MLGCGTSETASSSFAQLAEQASSQGSYVKEFETTRHDGLWVVTVDRSSEEPLPGTTIHAKRRKTAATNEKGRAFLKAPVPDSFILRHDAYRDRLYTRASLGVDSVVIALRPVSVPVSERVNSQ